MNNITALKETFLGLSSNEASFKKRGFDNTEHRIQKHLESVGETFVNGYNTALTSYELNELESSLNKLDPVLRGFGYEGAAMALSLLDRITFSPNTRFSEFLIGPGEKHKYMLHVGAGWAMARLPWGAKQHLESLDPLLRWLALDGYGFHEGYFHWKKYVTHKKRPRQFKGYELRAFDQGLGRSLWFVKGAQPILVAETIRHFDESRQSDLWSGIGLASTYAGGVPIEDIRYLKNASGHFHTSLLQGAAFAAKARDLADNMTKHTEMACMVYMGISSSQAAVLCDIAEIDLPQDSKDPAYEIWRQRIQVLAAQKEVA